MVNFPAVSGERKEVNPVKRSWFPVILILALIAGLLLFGHTAEEALPGFQKSGIPYTPFSDLREDGWYREDVKTVVEYGIMDGVAGQGYDPYGEVTLAQTIKIAACIHSIYETGRAAFSQTVPWYQTYVDYARAQGIVSQTYPDYTAPATRLQIAEIFSAALPESALPAQNKVADNAIFDVSAGSEGAAAVYRLYRAGITQGSTGTHDFLPNTTARRSEVSAMVARMIVPAKRLQFSMKEPVCSPDFTGSGIRTYLAVNLRWSEGDLADGYSIRMSRERNGPYVRLPDIEGAGTTSQDISVDALGTYYFQVAAFHTTEERTVLGAYSAPYEVIVEVPGESAYEAAREQARSYLDITVSKWGWGGLQYCYYDMDGNGIAEMFVRNSRYPDSINAIYTYTPQGHAICLFCDDLHDIPGENETFSWNCRLLGDGIVCSELVKRFYDGNNSLTSEIIGMDFSRLASDKKALALAESVVYDGVAYDQEYYESTTMSSRNFFRGSKTGFRSISESYFDSLYYRYGNYGSPISLGGMEWLDF